jgi:hypothetical protein
MKQTSFWAKANPRKAQLSIFFLYILINVIAFGGGILIYETGIRFEDFFLDIAFIVFLLSFLLYKKDAKYHYRKTLDFLLAISTFLMIAFWGNRMTDRVPYMPLSSYTASGVTIKSTPSGDHTDKEISVSQSLNKKDWQKAGNGKIKKEKRKIDTWVKVLLIALVLVAAFYLSYFVAALACNISCSGAEGLAIVVLVLGLAGTIGGGFFLIRRILGYRRRQRNA